MQTGILCQESSATSINTHQIHMFIKCYKISRQNTAQSLVSPGPNLHSPPLKKTSMQYTKWTFSISYEKRKNEMKMRKWSDILRILKWVITEDCVWWDFYENNLSTKCLESRIQMYKSTNCNAVLFHFVPSSLQSGNMPWIYFPVLTMNIIFKKLVPFVHRSVGTHKLIVIRQKKW